jgi:predicted flavoprotein YhiN
MTMAIDIVVVGAGASGMMAAGRAAELGASVLLLEKMSEPGRKILISGKGRCNLTNGKELDRFVLMYGNNGRFLYPAFKAFFRDELLAFFVKYGLETMIERDGRIFPASGDAHDVVLALEKYLRAGNAHLRPRSRVSEIVVEAGAAAGVKIGPDVVPAKSVILATGGSSYPATGSSGDGYRMASAVGHHVIRLRPALVPLVVDNRDFALRLQGVSLREIRVTAYRCASSAVTSSMQPAVEVGRGIPGRRRTEMVIESRRGDLMFTHYGLSGPATLLISLAVVDALSDGPVSVAIDLVPDQSKVELARHLQALFDNSGKKELRNALKALVPDKLASVLPEIAGISGAGLCNQLTSEQRDRLTERFKALSFDIKSSRPIGDAMVTAGGVSVDEIEPRTMASRRVAGLFLCGEVIDIDAETGGFNLQAAFATGYVAGEKAAAYVRGET